MEDMDEQCRCHENQTIRAGSHVPGCPAGQCGFRFKGRRLVRMKMSIYAPAPGNWMTKDCVCVLKPGHTENHCSADGLRALRTE